MKTSLCGTFPNIEAKRAQPTFRNNVSYGTALLISCVRKSTLIQPKRFDCRLVNCSGIEQAVIALKIGKGRSRLYVKRASYRTAAVARLLQYLLNVRNDLIGQHIT